MSTDALVTPEELLAMDDGERFELVGGRLEELDMNMLSSYVAGEIYHRLRLHCGQVEDHGWVLPEGTGFQCFPDDPEKVRRPDASYIRPGRISARAARQRGHVPIHPDLAVEVVSPRDAQYMVDQKVHDYLTAGVATVWVINPDSKCVQVHRHDGQSVILRSAEELTGDDFLPGFRCRIGDLFVMPGEA